MKEKNEGTKKKKKWKERKLVTLGVIKNQWDRIGAIFFSQAGVGEMSGWGHNPDNPDVGSGRSSSTRG